jgi:hypothetical protein
MQRAGRFAFGLLAAGLLTVAASVPAAAEYGNSGGNVQLYQVSASMNCNNPDLCSTLGGFWAWGVFNADGSFDAEVTFCSHMATPAGPNLAGAGHAHAEGQYTISEIFPGSGPWIVITHEIDTFTGRFAGTFDSGPEFMPVAPAAKAHLSTNDLLGFSAPGVTFQLTVTPMHTRS